MCFVDATFSGDVRNDIYITLEHGQFEKGSKRAERNVEVAINVIDGKGRTIPVSTSLAAMATVSHSSLRNVVTLISAH